MKVAVVGGGIVGLSAVRFLASRGHEVVLFEGFPLFHDRGSSHGASRIVRRAYPDAFYTACMASAYPMWAELEAESGRRLIDECGLLYVGDSNAPRVRTMVATLESLSVPHEILEETASLRLAPGDVAVHTPEAGWVDAAQALRATFDLAIAHGTQVREEVADFEELEKAYDAVVLAPGAWIGRFVGVDVRVTLQTFGYVAPKSPGPVWIDDTTLTYGIPSDPLGYKVGAHLSGPDVDPDTSSRAPWPDHLRQIETAARNRVGLSSPTVQNVKTCLYTSTPDEDFRIGRIGRKGVFASACSGHGFKLGPWTGRLLANIVEERDTPENYPRFLWPSRTIEP